MSSPHLDRTANPFAPIPANSHIIAGLSPQARAPEPMGDKPEPGSQGTGSGAGAPAQRQGSVKNGRIWENFKSWARDNKGLAAYFVTFLALSIITVGTFAIAGDGFHKIMTLKEMGNAVIGNTDGQVLLALVGFLTIVVPLIFLGYSLKDRDNQPEADASLDVPAVPEDPANALTQDEPQRSRHASAAGAASGVATVPHTAGASNAAAPLPSQTPVTVFDDGNALDADFQQAAAAADALDPVIPPAASAAAQPQPLQPEKVTVVRIVSSGATLPGAADSAVTVMARPEDTGNAKKKRPRKIVHKPGFQPVANASPAGAATVLNPSAAVNPAPIATPPPVPTAVSTGPATMLRKPLTVHHTLVAASAAPSTPATILAEAATARPWLGSLDPNLEANISQMVRGRASPATARHNPRSSDLILPSTVAYTPGLQPSLQPQLPQQNHAHTVMGQAGLLPPPPAPASLQPSLQPQPPQQVRGTLMQQAASRSPPLPSPSLQPMAATVISAAPAAPTPKTQPQNARRGSPAAPQRRVSTLAAVPETTKLADGSDEAMNMSAFLGGTLTSPAPKAKKKPAPQPAPAAVPPTDAHDAAHDAGFTSV